MSIAVDWDYDWPETATGAQTLRSPAVKAIGCRPNWFRPYVLESSALNPEGMRWLDVTAAFVQGQEQVSDH